MAEYKLRPADSLREVEMVRAMGVEFRQAEVGSDVTLEELEREFDFIFIGVGLGAMERLGIPGEDLPGVIDALRFIERYKTLPDFPTGRTVIVIGGGNTAIDAANAARRWAPKTSICSTAAAKPRCRPSRSSTITRKVEGVRFHWLAQPVEILEENGRAAAVKFVRTRLGEPDSNGRRIAEPIPGSEFADRLRHGDPRAGAVAARPPRCDLEIEGGGRCGRPRHRAHQQSEILRRRRLRERRPRSGGRGGRRQARRASVIAVNHG